MSESYVVDIGSGNTLRNKTAIVLNQAGDSPKNPILRGLGLAIDIKLTNNVSFFEVMLGESTPPEYKLLTFLEVGSYHYRMRSAAGYGDSMLPGEYSDPLRHFLSIEMTGPSHTVSTEREFWVQEDPLIELGFCAGSAVQSAWLASVSEAYFKNDATQAYGLTFDPGSPETEGVSAASSGSPHYIEAGPDRTPIEFAIYDVNQVYPLDIPVRIMENWKDEFNQKHFGGAKYVSIFEQGLAEDFQGPYITNVYQDDIDTLTSFQVRVADLDHEYSLVFRFRSELNDQYYVDKVVSFRILTADILNRDFTTDVRDTDMPEIVYTGSNYYWSGMTALVAGFSVLSAEVQVDETVVSLPTDDVTAFPLGWADLWATVYGGEVPIRFQRTASGTTIENFVETYKGSGSPVVFSKNLFRRYIHSNFAEWSPEIQFRFIEPDSGSVYLEFINNQTKYKQVTVFTELGSIAIPLPVRNGQRHDITSILTMSGASVLNDNVAILTQTENTFKLLRTGPVPRSPRLRSTDGGDNVTPVFTVAYPDVTVTFPATTDNGDSYTVELGDATGLFGESVILFGRKGLVRDGSGTLVPGGTTLITNGVSDCCDPTNATFFFVFRIKYTSGVYAWSVADFSYEIPTYGGYSGIPASGAHPGDLQVILYGTNLVIVSKPANLYQFYVTGNLGGPEWFDPGDVLNDQWYDISHLIDAAHSPLIIGYKLLEYDALGVPHVVNYGPYNVPRYVPVKTDPAAECTMEGSAWVTGRLTDGSWQLPLGKIDWVNQTIQFDSSTRHTDWVRFSVTNPLDKTQLIFNRRPGNFVVEDISRLFRGDTPHNLQPGQTVAVTFLHTDGPHIVGFYTINGEWVEPLQLNQLRGEL